jgi:hypothetical protein
MKHWLATGALLAATTAANAAVLDFSGDVCSNSNTGIGDFVACGNGGSINQAYGDAAAIDFNFSGNAGGTSSMLFWATAYSKLERIAYGNSSSSAPVITITALAGNFVSLGSFQLGAWPDTDRQTQLTVTELGTGNVLLSTGPFNLPGSAPSTFNINKTSSKGFQISFGPDGFNVGIDNIVYSTSPIPEPGTWALMALGLAGVGSMVRRRKTA